jgi:type IV pilus secretin PilQ/predicted competence protein
MSKQGKLMMAGMAVLLLLGSPARAADPAPAGAAGDPSAISITAADSRSLLRLDLTPGAAGPTVTIVGDGTLAYTSEVLSSPDRLVLDLPGTVSRLSVPQLAIGSGGVQRVRAGQYRTKPQPVTRVVFDLEGPVPHHIEAGEGGLVVAFGAPAGTESDVPAPAAGAGSDEVASILGETAAPAPAKRALPAQALEAYLREPSLAAPQADAGGARPMVMPSFETQTIETNAVRYNGKKISLNLVDADLKQVFRLFHEISGLNFVLDPAVDGKVTIVLDNVPWDQALDIILKNNALDKQVENNVIRIAPTVKLASEAAARKQLKEAKELEVEPVTVTRTLSYAKAKDVERVVREGGVLSPRGKVIIDERTNTLIVSDIPKRVEPLETLLATLDTETPQVMIEARIVETSRQFIQDYGVVWGVAAIADASRGTSTSLGFPHNASARYGLNLPGAGEASSLALKFGNVLDSFTLDVALNALETEGRGRILSSPKIATQNNERAEIEQGVRIPVVNTTATEINVEFVSASLRLAVTPQITAEGTVILDVQVENNSPDFVNSVGDVPAINTQRAQTKVLIADGGTTVIGGIFTVNEGQSETGVPWFRKLPVFGWLFKTRNVTNENRELLIFITPKIMKIG